MILMVLGLMTSTMFWLNMQLPIPSAFMAVNLLGIITGLLIMSIGMCEELSFFFPQEKVKETIRQVKKATV